MILGKSEDLFPETSVHGQFLYWGRKHSHWVSWNQCPVQPKARKPRYLHYSGNALALLCWN